MSYAGKIYLKESDAARLANRRIRIVKDDGAREPCENEDLVFAKADCLEDVPNDALKAWQFAPLNVWFYTTAERCKKMVAEDSSYWTPEKLDKFAEQEKKLYEDWFNGNVYGIIVEMWNARMRRFACVESVWGIYGEEELRATIPNYDKPGTIICIDSEEMKYDFDNVEMRVNEF